MEGRWLIVLLGPPGVGKGTQGQRLARELGWHYVATGDLLREAIQKGTPLGQRAKSFMERGDLVPDEIMTGLISEALRSVNRPVILLDGFPRTVAQATALDRLAEREGWRVWGAVLLTAEEEELIDRLSGRRICPRCGAIYNLRTQPPREDEKCDRCKSPLVQRGDDRPWVVRKRLAVYRDETRPVVQFYRRRDALWEVDANADPDRVYERLKGQLGVVIRCQKGRESLQGRSF